MTNFDRFIIILMLIALGLITSIQSGMIRDEISQARAQIALLSKQVNDISSQLDEHDVGIQQMQKAQDYETLCQSIPGLEKFIDWSRECEAINENF